MGSDWPVKSPYRKVTKIRTCRKVASFPSTGRLNLQDSHFAVTQDLSADGRPPPSIDDFKRSRGECSPDSGKEIVLYTHQGPIIG
jgi:hypothetical protein